jgi:hypothetical protein
MVGEGEAGIVGNCLRYSFDLKNEAVYHAHFSLDSVSLKGPPYQIRLARSGTVN